MSNDIATLINDLDAGVFAEKLATAISKNAMAVVDTGKEGEVVITLKMKQIANHHQVEVSHKIKFVRPTMRGKVSEEDTTTTPMHVGRGGKLSFYPENQMDLLKQSQLGTEA